MQVQRWNNNPISLITNHLTIIRVYSSSKIPAYPKPATKALRARAGKELEKAPTGEENLYVSYFHKRIDKGAVPEPEEFLLMVSRSANVKQKFSLLEDLEESKFCDLIVRVCREPFDEGDRVTLYVSDYTENAGFFNYTWDGVQDLDSGSGDMYGYTSKKRDDGEPSNKWIGPYGKKALQVTAWEPHASVIRDEVNAGDWVRLRNVQIKIGRDGNNLEGAMREERNLVNSAKVDVEVLDAHDKDDIDPRLKDAIRRWRDYTKEKDKQIKTLKASEGKRKHAPDDVDGRPSKASKRKRKQATDDTNELGKENKKENAKARRARERAEVFKKVQEQETKLREEIIGLNPLILCESPPDRPFQQVASILEEQYYHANIDGDKVRLPLPFVNAKYCANVRVVDFHPKQLEDFARPRKINAFEVLSDDSGSGSESASDSEEEETDGDGAARWEWRFALLLEDASPKAKEPKRLWAIVNNMEAQYLTNLDAADLRKDEATLVALREKLFTLWGELEERKHWELTMEAEARKRKLGAAPPPSDDEDGSNRRGSKAKADFAPKVSNKPFTCCITQYGIRKPETDPALADAGPEKRWKRVFGLSGTKISS